jgi:hypothetical protein
MVGIVSAMASRMSQINNRQTQLVDLCNILPEDIVKGYELMNQWRNKDKDKQIVQRIGFRQRFCIDSCLKPHSGNP